MKVDQSKYKELEAAAQQLRKSERGQRALKNLSQFFQEGGIGLDELNKKAATSLFLAALICPWDLPANLTTKNGEAA